MQLLVSVRDVEEGRQALAGGADIIDVKNPAEGSLGAATPGVLRSLVDLVAGARPVSAAIGDAADLPGTYALAAFGAALTGVEYVKVGLRYFSERPQAVRFIRAVGAAMAAAVETATGTGSITGAITGSITGANTGSITGATNDSNTGATTRGPIDGQTGAGPRLVVVGYADARRIGTLLPEEIPAAAAEAGAHVAMLDTAVKDGRGLWDWFDQEELDHFVGQCHDYGLEAALAGSLRLEDLPRTAATGPDIIGVRGAACAGGRLGRIEAAKVEQLRQALHLPRSG